MKIRFEGDSKRLILNQQQEFRTDLGWDESIQSYEDEVLLDIINPIENYETCRYIHKPYTSSNGIYQTDIWFHFYFVEDGGYTLDYTPQGLDQTTKLLADVKNSFFRLEFYKTPNNEAPNRSNRRLVFAKNLSLPIGEKCFYDDIKTEMYVPVFMGSNYKNKENMYLFWFEDDTVLEETTLTGTTFFMTAKFYNAVDGSRTQFANKEISQGSDLVEEDDLYFLVEMDRSNAPTYHYEISDYDSTGNVRGNRRGESSDPIKFYEIGGSGSRTPTPTSTGGTCNFAVDVTIGNLPTPTPTSNGVVPTPTPSPTAAYYWYELTRCDVPSTVCYSVPIQGGGSSSAGKVFWSASGNYYTMGNYWNTATETDPGVGDCSDKLEGTIVTGVCSDYVTVPTPTSTYHATQTVEILECGTVSPYMYVTIDGNSGLPNGFAIKIQSSGGTFNGTKCWEITNSNYTGPLLDATVTLVGQPYYSGCSSCTPG